jgi:hypothetical protein
MNFVIPIVFSFALVMSIVLLENFVKNLMAFIKFYSAPGMKDGALFKGWMVWAVALLWALFITLKLYF